MINNNLRIKNRGRGVQLEVKHGNTWYIIPTMDAIKVREPKQIKGTREKSLEKKPMSRIRTLGGGIDADNAVVIDLDNVVTLCTSNTNKTHFSLPMGIPGQMKVIVHLSRDNNANMNVSLKISDGGALRVFVSDHPGKALLLFCDGNYWHPVGGEFSNTHSPGAWSLP